MATHAKFVLDRDNSVSTLGNKKARVSKQEVWIETLRQLFALDLGLSQTLAQSGFFLF
jgi:ribosomal protein L19E